MVAFCTLAAMTTAPGSGTSRRAKYVATAPGLCDLLCLVIGHAYAQLVRTLRGHSDAVTSLAVSPDGRFVYTAAADKTVKAWEAASGEVSHKCTVARIRLVIPSLRQQVCSAPEGSEEACRFVRTGRPAKRTGTFRERRAERSRRPCAKNMDDMRSRRWTAQQRNRRVHRVSAQSPCHPKVATCTPAASRMT
jgi:hypothetical protein